MHSPQWVRALAVAVVTAAGAAVCTPWTQRLVPDAPGSDSYHLPVTWQDIAQPIVLAVIALAAGRAGVAPWLAGVAVTVPAAVVYGVYGQFFQDSIGVNLWPVGLLLLAPPVFLAALGLAYLGRLLRRRSGAGDGSAPAAG